jgi:hypothetical protein
MWATEEDWVKFRTTPHTGHVPSHIPTLVRDEFLPRSAEKRKREETAENDNINGDDGNADDGDGNVNGGNNVDVTVTPAKKVGDRRKWCFRCTYWKRVRTGESTRVLTLSRVEGSKPKKTNSFCMRCRVALCQDCFRAWHDVVQLLPTPTAAEETTAAEEMIT